MHLEDPEAALQELLVNAFDGNPDGLLAWVRVALGPPIYNELSTSKPLKSLAFDTMLAARRHGRLDQAMFHSLRRERPALAGPIDLVARKVPLNGGKTVERPFVAVAREQVQIAYEDDQQ